MRTRQHSVLVHKVAIAIAAVLLLSLPLSAIRAQVSNDDLSSQQFYNSEPYLAINPNNHQQIVVAWMAMSGVKLGIAVRHSQDGGATWSDATIIPHAQPDWTSADVSLAWQRSGKLFLSFIDHNIAKDSGGVYITASIDGGATWDTPIEAVDAHANDDMPIDRPWLVTDPSRQSTPAELYLVTKPTSWNPLPNRPYFTRSIDGGKTWSALARLDSVPFEANNIIAPMSAPAVASNGTLYIAYPCYDLSQGAHYGFALATSTNNGSSFVRSMLYKGTGSHDTGFKNGYHLVCDPANPQHLTLIASTAFQANNNIIALTSFDGGQTWQGPIKINDDIGNTGHDMSWPMIEQSGTIVVLWRDRRNAGTPGDSANLPTDTYYSYSNDGGLTWAPNIRLSDSTAPFAPVLAGNGNDFLSGALADDTLYAAWADTRTGRLRLYFAKAALGSASLVSPHELSISSFGIRTAVLSRHTLSLQASLDKSKSFDVTLYDITGKLIARKEYSPAQDQVQLNIPDIPVGAYLLVLQQGEKKDARRVVMTE